MSGEIGSKMYQIGYFRISKFYVLEVELWEFFLCIIGLSDGYADRFFIYTPNVN